MANLRLREASGFGRPAYRDPAQLVFERIPPASPAPSDVNCSARAYERVEGGSQNTRQEMLPGRQWLAGINPYIYPASASSSRPTDPLSSMPSSLAASPKPPLHTLGRAYESDVPLRFAGSTTSVGGPAGVESGGEDMRSRSDSIYSAYSVTSTGSPINEGGERRRSSNAPFAPDQRPTNVYSPEAYRSLVDPMAPQPLTVPERSPKQPIGPVHTPSTSTSSSARSGYATSSARSFIDNHRALDSPEKRRDEPIAGHAPSHYPDPHTNDSISRASQFGSHSSESQPPKSPPPPYSNQSPKKRRRRRESYYEAATAKSDQIIASQYPRASIHPALREKSLSVSSSIAASENTKMPTPEPSPLPVTQSRPLSPISVRSNDSIGDRLQPTQSAPALMPPTSSSPPISTSAYFQAYRPTSTASAPPDEDSAPISSSSSPYLPYREPRAQSMSSIPPVAELPASPQRQVMPRLASPTDTFKIALPLSTLNEPVEDTWKEVQRSTSGHPLDEKLKSMTLEPRPDLQKRHTAQGLVELSDVKRVMSPPEAASPAAMIRMRNQERKRGGKKRGYTIVNPD